MKICRNTFCELLIALAVAGCGGSNDNGTLATNALGEYVTLSGQVQSWSGLTGPACPWQGNQGAVDNCGGAAGSIATDGSFAVPLPGGPSVAGAQWQSPCPPPSVGGDAVALAIDGIVLPGAIATQLDVIVAGQHERHVHYVHVDKELVTSGTACAIDFKPGWNAYIDDVVMMADGSVGMRYDYTGPIPPGAQWVVQ